MNKEFDALQARQQLIWAQVANVLDKRVSVLLASPPTVRPPISIVREATVSQKPLMPLMPRQTKPTANLAYAMENRPRREAVVTFPTLPVLISSPGLEDTRAASTGSPGEVCIFASVWTSRLRVTSGIVADSQPDLVAGELRRHTTCSKCDVGMVSTDTNG